MINRISILKHLESEYDEYLKPEKIQSARINSFVGIILFLCSFALDYGLQLSSLQESAFSKVLVIIALIATFYMTYASSFFIKNYHLIVPFAFIVPTASLGYTLSIARPDDLAYYIYFSGFIVIISMLYSWAHLSTKNLVVTTSIIFGIYITAVLMRETAGIHSSYEVLFGTLFFLMSGIVMGVVGKLVRDSHLRQNFLLQQSLNKAIKEKIKEAERFEFYSNHDQLTGLANRRFAERSFNESLQEIKQENTSTIVLMFLDLNGFKAINDTYGHDAGDEVLKVTSERLKQCTREADTIIRLGGDEFLISLVVNVNDPHIVDETREKINEIISKPIIFNKNSLTITVSIGIASYPDDGASLESLIKVSDEKMYKDKKAFKAKNHASNIISI